MTTTVSLSPARVRWTIYEGATFKQQITVLTAGIGSNPVDLTEYTNATLTVRMSIGGSILMTLSSPSNGIVLGGTQGTVTITISDTVTANLPWKQAVFDLLITEPDGVTVDALVTGNFSVGGLIS
jgi:hypothetical protein